MYYPVYKKIDSSKVTAGKFSSMNQFIHYMKDGNSFYKIISIIDNEEEYEKHAYKYDHVKFLAEKAREDMLIRLKGLIGGRIILHIHVDNALVSTIQGNLYHIDYSNYRVVGANDDIAFFSSDDIYYIDKKNEICVEMRCKKN